MKVEVIFEHDADSLLIKMPCAPMIGDEFTIEQNDDDDFYKVYNRDFIIKNGKLDKVKIWVKDL